MTLRVVFQIDEQIGRDLVRTLRRPELGTVYSFWELTYVTALNVYIGQQSDSTAMLYCGLKERGEMGTFLKLRKIEPDFKFYSSYMPKPFKPCGLKPEKWCR